MTGAWLIALSVALLVVSAVLWRRQVALRRTAYIRSFELPRGLFERLRRRRPSLTLKDCQLVAHGLRQFFLAYLAGGRRFVSMPSQVADDLWHEFILYTRDYDAFCRRAFGGFLHHTPAVVLGSNRHGNEGLRRCWWHVCKEENINPRQPTRLPLLFALDAKLHIADGFRYVADCELVRRAGGAVARAGGGTGGGPVHCGGDFGSTAFDGGTDGFGDSSGGDGAGDSGGGDGCGGGGCGGGD
jgi:hypothetical protein